MTTLQGAREDPISLAKRSLFTNHGSIRQRGPGRGPGRGLFLNVPRRCPRSKEPSRIPLAVLASLWFKFIRVISSFVEL